MTWVFLALVSGLGAIAVGLIGFGSSLVILPTLAVVFPTMFAPEVALRLAAGTTMATMTVGALSAGIAQARSGQVAWPLLRLAVFPYLAGALLGPWGARFLPVQALRLYIAAILVLLGLWALRPRGGASEHGRTWQAHRTEIRAVLFVIGIASSAAGTASGVFAIPYLSRFDLPLRTVIGTSTVSAAFYSVFGMLGYISSGWEAEGLPPWSLGFVYLPAFALMSAVGAACAPLGVRLAGRVSEGLLRRLVAIVLLSAAVVIALRA
ncbi:MAG: sulfite exporter TauE/SafE family protein [Betaproteobacteria bacterium]|nr:sulfite exporter TauE/SafE family protein [Betaproteobacteria bacterium]